MHIWPTLVLALAGMLCLIGCSKRPDAGQGGKGGGPQSVPVTVATAGQKATSVTVRSFGTVEAFANVEVKAQVTGVLTEVHFTEGQKVRKGDLLFSIDPRQPQAVLKMAQANLERDQAQLKNAEREAGRQTELLHKGFTSQDEYDKVTTAVETLRAAVSADRAAVENAALQLDYCSIRSPVDGYTGNLHVHRGNLIKANDVSIVSVRQIDPIYVSFWVAEQHLPTIQKERAAHPLDVAVTPSGEAGRTAHGTLSFMDNTVDPANHMIRLRATLDNADGRLWPGQYADVVLSLGEEPNSIVVPSQAIQVGQSGQFVYVVKQDQTVEDRPITAGRVLNGETVVTGVRPGEVVVTDGQLRLVPGAKVQVKESPKR